jgi:hypothetical protein
VGAVTLPEGLVDILASEELFDGQLVSQALPLLTVADTGHPHVCLLSTAQVDVDRSRTAALVSVAGRETTRNLDRSGLATIVAVRGKTAFYAKCRTVDRVDVEGRAGFALEAIHVKPDSAGVDLVAMGFHFREQLARAEQWALDAAVLAQLRLRRDGVVWL